MKKILFAAAALATISLASCGNGEKSDSNADSDTIDFAAEQTTVTPIDTVGDTVQAIVEQAVAVGQEVVPAQK